MRILHVYKGFDPPVRGGIEKHVALMCRFQRQWAQVEALVCSGGFRTRFRLWKDVPITEVGEWGRFQSAPVSPLFPFYLRKAEADVIVVQTPNPTAEVAWLLARPRARLVVRYQSDVVRQAAAMRFYAPVQQRFLEQASLIIASSQEYVESSSMLQPFLERCRVLPLGIVPEDYETPRPDRVKALREQYGGDYVLFAGRHRYYKGLEYLVRAVMDINAPVVIAGDGPERAWCQRLSGELGVKVFFPGALGHDDLVDHLHGCALFAFPSVARSEAFCLSMLEAHVCARPVVATRLGTGVEHVNQHGVTGLNVTPRDSKALGKAVNELLRDPVRRERMGEAARRRVKQKFHAEQIARAEFDMYRDVLA